MKGKEVETLWAEVRELSLGNSVDRLHSPPTPLQFLRDFVSQNKPCIISNAISHWPALSLWPTPSYLSTTLSSSLVSLHLTPNGHADALVPHLLHPSLCFVSAHVQPTPFPQAFNVIRQPPNHLVPYLQQQNDCFRTEYRELESDCDGHISWASEALGCLPEAVNLWIGNHLSETSFHKDHYENLYAVVSGEKHFLLLPPTDVQRMYIKEYPAARYSYSEESGEFGLELEEPERYVPWCSVDPYPATGSEEQERSKFPLYFNGPKPFKVSVKAGEILYLPSMWFHHVRQSPGEGGCTIAVNYWYDMQFDIKYAYFNFLQSLPYQSTDDPTIPESESEESGPHASPNHLNSRFSSDRSATNNVEINKDRDNVQVLSFYC
ncbi:hypothetical protein CRYUN_Cryun03dG0124700 [Craigia yunnanensis]